MKSTLTTEYWKKENKLTHCKRCGKELTVYKIYYCSSRCGWRYRDDILKGELIEEKDDDNKEV